MAHSTSSRFSIAKEGVPQIVGAFDKFEMHKTPKFPLGYKVETADGKIFRYAHFGADTNRGVLVSADLSEVGQVDLDNSVVAPASSVSGTDGAIGTKFVEVTIASITLDQFAGSTLVVTDDAGEGYSYDIIGNTATGTPATGNIRLSLAQPLQVALTTASDISIQPCLYNDLEVATTGTDAIVAGVTCSTMDVSEQAYGWIQTKGLVGVLQDAKVPTVGSIVTLSKLTAGAVGPLGGASSAATDYVAEPIVGICVDPGDSTGHSVIKLNVE